MNVKQKINKILVYIFSVFWSFVTLYPLFFTFLSSLKNTDEIYFKPFSLPGVYRFGNYIAALFSANISRAISNSLLISVCAVFISILIGSMASYVIARYEIKINNLILTYFIIGLMIPVHSLLIPLVRFINSINAGDRYITMILLYAGFYLPWSIFILTGHMKGINKEIEESAIIDGCGPFQLLFKIFIPLCKPAIATAATVSFLFIYNELIFASLFIRSEGLYTISLALLSFKGQFTVSLGPVFASIILSIIPMVIMYLVFQESVEKGLAAGAVKG